MVFITTQLQCCNNRKLAVCIFDWRQTRASPTRRALAHLTCPVPACYYVREPVVQLLFATQKLLDLGSRNSYPLLYCFCPIIFYLSLRAPIIIRISLTQGNLPSRETSPQTLSSRPDSPSQWIDANDGVLESQNGRLSILVKVDG